MMVPKLEAEICAYLHQLPLDQQRHVLDFVRALVTSRVRGVPGQALGKTIVKGWREARSCTAAADAPSTLE